MESGAHLLIILVFAWVLGHGAEAIKLPASVGQVMAGVVVGVAGGHLSPYVPLFDGISSSSAITGVGEAGIFFLLLYAGIEMRPDELAKNGGEAIAVAAGGVIVPLLLGFALAWYALPASDTHAIQSLVVGVALSISAIAVAAKVFLDFNLLHHSIGRVVISAAVIDDIIGLVLLGMVTSVLATGGPPSAFSVFYLLVQVALFFGVTWILGHKFSKPFWSAIHKVHMPGIRLMALLSIAIIYGLFAEWLGLHFILGPFMAGLYFEPASAGHKAYKNTDRTINNLTKGILGPVFFASIGLMVDPSALFYVPEFLFMLVLIAIGGKLVGCGVPAYVVNGHDVRNASAIGIGMSGRGGIELLV
ncbi:MAG: cation:proton antiporter, partial [Rhodospirillaceae bacterium]|nr:cation:proton antiporter [Rhodospirillaceae bacterium]